MLSFPCPFPTMIFCPESFILTKNLRLYRSIYPLFIPWAICLKFVLPKILICNQFSNKQMKVAIIQAANWFKIGTIFLSADANFRLPADSALRAQHNLIHLFWINWLKMMENLEIYETLKKHLAKHVTAMAVQTHDMFKHDRLFNTYSKKKEPVLLPPLLLGCATSWLQYL